MKNTINKKQLTIILGVLLLAIVIMLAIALTRKTGNQPISGGQDNNQAFKVEMMSDQEKQDMNIDSQARVQVLERTDSGDVMTYKVIKSDSDIVNNLSEIQ